MDSFSYEGSAYSTAMSDDDEPLLETSSGLMGSSTENNTNQFYTMYKQPGLLPKSLVTGSRDFVTTHGGGTVQLAATFTRASIPTVTAAQPNKNTVTNLLNEAEPTPWLSSNSAPNSSSAPSFQMKAVQQSKVQRKTKTRQNTPPLSSTRVNYGNKRVEDKAPRKKVVKDKSRTRKVDSKRAARDENAAIMYRNLFHVLECKVPTALQERFENWRVYVDTAVGYSGNAKIFKKKPDEGEKALSLYCTIEDTSSRPLSQCGDCVEYFSNRMYFKVNQHIRGRIAIVKNNNLIKIENGIFKINCKFMCACKHHSVDSFVFRLHLFDNVTQQYCMAAQQNIFVKQWRKSSQKKEQVVISCHPSQIGPIDKT